MSDFPDVVVLLPGITGSRLRKDGEVVWGFSAKALGRALFSGGGSLRDALFIEEDDPEADELGDGVVADALLDDLHLIPGFWKIDGYGHVRDVLRRQLRLAPGTNFFDFPYDWRRDNRVAARKLKRATDRWLEERRQTVPDAKLVLVGHSMGGLVSRYFLEKLGGYRDTRALVTFGTPYRGSLNALDTLANGVHKGPFHLKEVSELTRSFTAIYQLLPRYACYDGGDGLVRVGETSGIPNVDAGRAAESLAFYREISDAVEENKQDPDYQYRIYPIVGVSQETSQFAELDGSAVKLHPEEKDGNDIGGDGTVPRVSATPIEYSTAQNEMFAGTKHGSLQNADDVLLHVARRISELHVDISGYRAQPDADAEPAREPTRVRLDVDDLYLASEPVVVRARPEAEGTAVEATITSSEGAAPVPVPLSPGEEGWLEGTAGPLPEGTYRVRVTGSGTVELAEDAFAVAGEG